MTHSPRSKQKEQLHHLPTMPLFLLKSKTNIHQYPTLRAAFQPDIALFTIQEIQPLPDIVKTNTLTIRRSFSDLPVDLCHFFRFQKGAGILHLQWQNAPFSGSGDKCAAPPRSCFRERNNSPSPAE